MQFDLVFALRAVMAAFLLAGVSVLAYWVIREQLLSKGLSAADKALRLASVRHGADEKGPSWLRRQYLYSRVSHVFPRLTYEMLVVVMAVLGFFGLLLGFGMCGTVFGAFLVAVLLAVVPVVSMSVMARSNYKKIDASLLQFLNQLGNFSVLSGEITGVFHQVAKFLPDPLASILDECYYDAQTSGNVRRAMEAMRVKVQNPKFREIICNIEVCLQYTDNYALAVNALRQNLIDDANAKADRKSMASSSCVNMVIISVLLVFVLFLLNRMLLLDVWNLMFASVPGYLALCVIFVSYLTFFIAYGNAER